MLRTGLDVALGHLAALPLDAIDGEAPVLHLVAFSVYGQGSGIVQPRCRRVSELLLARVAWQAQPLY